MILNPELIQQIRSEFKIPENRYYTVQLYPKNMAGIVRVSGHRYIESRKISKSDQVEVFV